jgi:RNA polymerase sigma factor (sigma-70 family)
MGTNAIHGVLQHLRRAVLQQESAGLSDGELLERYVDRQDGSALETLIHRHGAMVLAVCRRILGNEADAEDAFQATFLVLVRKAASIRSRAMVSNWLYGVAHNTALKAKAMNRRRRTREREAGAIAKPEAHEAVWQEVKALLDRELSALPDPYRTAIVLCDLEGKTIKQAAGYLGWPQGTVATRLRRGRALLAKRLLKHGLTLSIGGLARAVSQGATAVHVPASLIGSTIRATTAVSLGIAQTPVVSAKVAILAEGVLTGMLLHKLKITLAFCVATCMMVAGASLPTYQAWAAAGTKAKVASAPPANAECAGEPQATDNSKPRSDDLPPKGSDAPATVPGELSIRGSGKVITKEVPLADFTTIEVSRSIQVELTRADSFRVALTSDDNLLPYFQASKDGSVLRLTLDPKLKSFWARALKATVAMPTLERVSLEQHSRLTWKGFQSAKVFRAKVTGGSILDGEIEAEKVDLEATGLSTVTLKGSASEATVSASRQSLLLLAGLALDQASVTLKNGSMATVHVKTRLEYDLSAFSHLGYLGNPGITKGTTSGASLAVPHSLNSGREGAKPDTGNAPQPIPHLHHRASPAQGLDLQRTGSVSPERVTVGKRVPDFALRDLDGRTVMFSELQKDAKRTTKGVVLLSFWCSTCSSCRRVEQHLDKLAKDYQGEALVLALDANAGETSEDVRAFAKKTGLTLPIFLNPDGRTADIFGTEVTTTTVVIDGEGVLRYCGRFREGDRHTYAEDALKAVLAGKEVAVKTTRQDG